MTRTIPAPMYGIQFTMLPPFDPSPGHSFPSALKGGLRCCQSFYSPNSVSPEVESHYFFSDLSYDISLADSTGLHKVFDEAVPFLPLLPKVTNLGSQVSLRFLARDWATTRMALNNTLEQMGLARVSMSPALHQA